GPDRGVPDVRVADVRVSDLGRPDHRSPDAPKVVLLSNGVCSSTTMGPMASGAGEDGHLAASRLTPKHYPFTVTQVRYALLPGSSLKCHTGMAHRVDIYAAGGVAPAAFPIVLRSISVNAQANGSTIRVITLDVTPPLVLTQGQQLFVAVEMRIDANSNRTCLRSCFPPSGALPGRDYWSNAASAPYPWKSLKDSGIPAVYSTQALGY
ncbi:MAG: hypothetical protein KAI47_14285, partial [Deltaproteobacteria bacterium]|nr:hypothetical protein [Deltaproteobacteria bacterium]